MNIIITKHALDRALERFGLETEELCILVKQAWAYGYKRHEFSGPLRRYIDSKAVSHDTTPLFHDGILFIFDTDRLVTLYRVPVQYSKQFPLFEKEEYAA